MIRIATAPVFPRRSYRYDTPGRPTPRTLARQGATRNDVFNYNDRSELISDVVHGTGLNGWDYDRAAAASSSGVASNKKACANQLNQYTAIEDESHDVFTPTYDDDGNQTRIKTSTGIWNVTYNAKNRPVLFTKDDNSVSVACTYDYMGRRATKVVTENGVVTTSHRFLYRGYLQIACCDRKRSTHPCLWLITWDPTQDVATRPLAIQKDGTWYTYGWDLTKNIWEAYTTTGYIGTAYTYTAYGQVSANGSITQPIQWSSEVRDEELELVYYNWRYYNTRDGKWTSRDKIKEELGANLYNFAKNNSIKEIDILGNIAWVVIIPCIKGMATGAVYDVALQECKCCYKQVGWKIWKCDLEECPPINVCSVIVSAIVGCVTGYIPTPHIPTTVEGLRLLAIKTGANAFAKWLGKLNCST